MPTSNGRSNAQYPGFKAYALSVYFNLLLTRPPHSLGWDVHTHIIFSCSGKGTRCTLLEKLSRLSCFNLVSNPVCTNASSRLQSRAELIRATGRMHCIFLNAAFLFERRQSLACSIFFKGDTRSACSQVISTCWRVCLCLESGATSSRLVSAQLHVRVLQNAYYNQCQSFIPATLRTNLAEMLPRPHRFRTHPGHSPWYERHLCIARGSIEAPNDRSSLRATVLQRHYGSPAVSIVCIAASGDRPCAQFTGVN